MELSETTGAALAPEIGREEEKKAEKVLSSEMDWVRNRTWFYNAKAAFHKVFGFFFSFYFFFCKFPYEQIMQLPL